MRRYAHAKCGPGVALALHTCRAHMSSCTTEAACPPPPPHLQGPHEQLHH